MTGPSPQASQPQSGGAVQVVRVAAPAIGTVSSVADVDAALGKCEKAILSAAKALFQQDSSKPWAYFLSRVGAWITLGELPEAQGTVTYVPAPDPGVVADLQAHAGNARWAELLRQAEGAVGDYPFWLDLHYWVAKALDSIGGTSKAPIGVVENMTLGFVDRFPQVLSLQFRGGMPFASPDTNEWLDQLRRKGGGGGAADAALEADRKEREGKLSVAREAIAAGRVGDGVGLMVQLARRSPDARTSFRLELDAAKLALEAQKPGVARPILEGLLRQIDSRYLETWDPELCVSVYAALLSSLRATNPPIVDADTREAVIIEKICRLDPALAVRMGL
jgi:type VI secretion system protein VasJ